MSNEIEVKLVLDQAQLNGPTALQLVEMFKQIAGNEAFGNAVEQVFHDRSSFVADLKGIMNVQDTDDLRYDIINSYDLENAIDAQVENWIGNSDLYYLPDTVSDLQSSFEEYDLMQMQDDLNRDEEAIDNLKNEFQEQDGKWDSFVGDIRDRLDTIEDKLSIDTSEEGYRTIDGLQERVLELEKNVANLMAINERQMHIIHNIQGVELT
tara:strand:+ start:4377 stop:5003 length:627 start_codon:yes stop_codon:yes gene_type:complete